MGKAKTMRAFQYHSYAKEGAQDLKLVELPIPKPNKGEVLLKVEAVSLNPVDWKIQKGQLRPFLPMRFPYVPCTDVAGEIVEIGSNVQSFNVGDKVVCWLMITGAGGLAEFTVASPKYMAKRPPEVSADEGACLPIAGLTALQAVRDYAGINLNEPTSNLNILITAASGGVGHFALQLAKLAGAHITATCGARNLEVVKSLGADEVLDYKSPEGAILKSPSECKYDIVVTCAYGLPWSMFQPNLKPKAKVIDVSPNFSNIMQAAIKKLTLSNQQISPVCMLPSSKDLQLLVDLTREGKIKCLVDSKYHFSNAKDAWSRCMEGHATGKVVVSFSE